jgi:hypothetical protein
MSFKNEKREIVLQSLSMGLKFTHLADIVPPYTKMPTTEGYKLTYKNPILAILLVNTMEHWEKQFLKTNGVQPGDDTEALNNIFESVRGEDKIWPDITVFCNYSRFINGAWNNYTHVVSEQGQQQCLVGITFQEIELSRAFYWPHDQLFPRIKPTNIFYHQLEPIKPEPATTIEYKDELEIVQYFK